MEPIIIEKKKGRLLGRSIMKTLLNGLGDGFYKVTIKKMHHSRSNQQNRWLWGQIYPRILHGLIDAGWENVTTEEQVHEMCKVMFAGTDIVNPNTGEITTIPNRTSEMDTVTFSLYCMQLRMFASDMLGITIPEPNERLLQE